MKFELMASMMCADYGNLEREVRELEEGVLDRLAAGSIDPAGLVTHRFPLDALDRGLCIMRDKTEEYCKIMVG